MFSSQFDEDEIPVEELFRTEKQMPLLERTALQMATGKILDVGAGSGCHSPVSYTHLDVYKRQPCQPYEPACTVFFLIQYKKRSRLKSTFETAS